MDERITESNALPFHIALRFVYELHSRNDFNKHQHSYDRRFSMPYMDAKPKQNSLLKAIGAPQPAASPAVPKFTFERAWRLRCNEIYVLAQRADGRCQAARKTLFLVDTILFAEQKEPKRKIAQGEKIK